MQRFTAMVALALAIITMIVTFPYAALANHSWGNYHWARTANPFTLKLGDNVSSAWDPYLSTASADWSQSSVLDTTVVPGNTSPRRCAPTSGRVEVCNERYGNNGWLGIAQIWVSGSHITQGIVKLNDTYFNTTKYNTPAWRNMVMCQEVGHTFGLAHQDEDFNNPNMNTCMDYTSNPESNQHPNSHDYQQLETIYSHLDNFTTVGDANATAKLPPPMRNGDFSASAEWGRLVARSASGHQEIYERDFGNGHKIVTHVTWVESRRP